MGNIVDADLDYDSDDLMSTSPEPSYYDVDIIGSRNDLDAAALSGVDPMEVELEDIRMKAVTEHYTKPTSWGPASLIDRLFCCASSRPGSGISLNQVTVM